VSAAGVDVHFTGLAELMFQLRQLPEQLQQQGGEIVTAAARGAAAADFRDYPVGRPHKRKGRIVGGGTLKNGLDLEAYQIRGAISYRLRNTAPHGTIFDKGTTDRRTRAGAERGAMPAGHIFIPHAIAYRAQMYRELVALVEAAGLHVTGFAA
jgi:hypothetical protein